MISQGAVASQTSKATSWQYLGTYGFFPNETISRALGLPRCDGNETNSLNFLNNDYPASDYDVGYIIEVTSSSGFFPNSVSCDSRYFKAV